MIRKIGVHFQEKSIIFGRLVDVSKSFLFCIMVQNVLFNWKKISSKTRFHCLILAISRQFARVPLYGRFTSQLATLSFNFYLILANKWRINIVRNRNFRFTYETIVAYKIDFHVRL